MVRCGAALALVASAFLISSLISPARAGAEAHAPGSTLEDMMALIDLGTPLGGVSVSPDGAYIAVFTRRVDRRVDSRVDSGALDARHTLLIIPAEGGGAAIAGDGGWAAYPETAARQSGLDYQRFPLWSPDGDWIAYEAERDGRLELWRSARDGAVQEKLPTGEGDVVGFAWLSSTRIVFQTGPSPADLRSQRMEEARDGFRVSDDFDAGYGLRPRPRANPDPRVLDLATGALTPASPSERALLQRDAMVEPIVANPRDRRAFVRDIDGQSNAAAPARGVFHIAENGEDVRCTLDPCSGQLLQAGVLDDGQVWFTRREGFADRLVGLYLWNPAAHHVRRLRLEDEQLVRCAGARNGIMCLQDAPTQPRRLVVVSPQDGRSRVLYDPNPTWRADAAPRIDLLQFQDRAGLQSFARLIYPIGYRADRFFPMVIVQYRSRGFLRGGVGGEYPIFPLAARGYFVLSVDRPEVPQWSASLSDGELDRLLEIEGEEERMKLDALEALIGQALQRARIDPRRIAITGMSDGAETLYWALRRRTYAAAVASSPPTDPSRYALMSESFRASVRALLPAPWPNASEQNLTWWRRNAALFFADEINTPLLMNLAQSEALDALPLAVRLRERGTPVETFIFPGAYHIKARPAQLLAAQRRSFAWIDFWLRGAEEPDIADPDRLPHWRELRRISQALHAEAPSPAP